MTACPKLEDAVTGQAVYVLVPRVPTKEMLRAAADEALAEDALGVWKSMIEEYENTTSANQTPGV